MTIENLINMETNVINIRKQSIPKLLGLLGKALSEEGDSICLKECKYSGGYTMIKLGEELVDEYGEEDPVVTKLPESLMSYTEEELQMMDDTFDCPEIGETDRYQCKNICSLRKECERWSNL